MVCQPDQLFGRPVLSTHPGLQMPQWEGTQPSVPRGPVAGMDAEPLINEVDLCNKFNLVNFALSY